MFPLKKPFKLKGFVFQKDLFMNDFIPKLQKPIDLLLGKTRISRNDICIKKCCVCVCLKIYLVPFFKIKPLDDALL